MAHGIYEILYIFISSWVKACAFFFFPPTMSPSSFAWMACGVPDPWVPSSAPFQLWVPHPLLVAQPRLLGGPGALGLALELAGSREPGYRGRDMSLQFQELGWRLWLWGGTDPAGCWQQGPPTSQHSHSASPCTLVSKKAVTRPAEPAPHPWASLSHSPTPENCLTVFSD